jgi:abhydrolase domain-containing protein 4
MKNRFLKIGLSLLGTGIGGGLFLLNLLPSPASPQALQAAEEKVLNQVKAPMEHRMVQAGQYRLHTLIVGDQGKPPLVMLHGHGGGVGVFVQNFDALSKHHTLYAVDSLGWGRSDRPEFEGKTPEDAQAWWVDSLEAWRLSIGLEQFTLLGHSMGGFIATSYGLKHPESIQGLILVDAGGMTRKTKLWNRIYFNLTPQRIVRLLGPWGPKIVAGKVEGTSLLEKNLIEYYYQISAAPASGEVAFSKILGFKEWKLPTLEKMSQLSMPVTLIWGENDAVTIPQNAKSAHDLLPNSRLIFIPNVGHSPYSEDPATFHQAVQQAF